MTQQTSRTGLQASSLGVADIVFFVVAAAAPLGATLGVAPVVFSIGGTAAPGLFLIASIVLFLFSIGFAAMSRYVVSAGGFAELVSKGLGQTLGRAAAGIAILAYICMLCGIYGQFASFGVDTLKSSLGLDLSWQTVGIAAIIVIGVFGYLHIDLSAKILGVLMILEVLILVLFDVAVIAQTPFSEMKFAGTFPTDVTVPGMGAALMFAFACYVGFESTTLYGEEARDPERTVPRATYVAIGLIAAFYTITMWCLGVAYGADKVQEAAAADMVNFVYAANTQFVGQWSTSLMQILAITSVFAVLLSFHNALCRYLFALARSGFLPQQLSSVHPRFRSPHKASITLSVITLVILGLFIIGKADPMGQLYLYNVALGTLSILVLQAFGAIAVIGFFLKREDRSLWQGIIAPAIGGLGLIVVVALAIANFGDLSGAKEGLAQYLPLLVIVAAVVGILNVPGRRTATHGIASE